MIPWKAGSDLANSGTANTSQNECCTAQRKVTRIQLIGNY